MVFRSSSSSQSGNIFFALFGAVALVGILAAAATSFMKGPLATSVKLTKMNSAETQMSVGAQIAVMASANQANSGDCDLDSFVEPIEWRDAGALPKPTNGGLIPMTVGISKKDPWGTEYGYCVWNHGTITSGSGCNANLLAGTNSKAYQVAALVSAGPDKAFTTTCRTFATADANSDGDLLDAGDSPLISKAAETDDDIIFSYTYDEATGASGGLWSLKSGDPNTAVINKKIETTGVASLRGGVLLPDKSLITCDASNSGVMAKSATGIEICDGAGNWTSIGGSSGALSTTPACAAPADAGNVRYNSVSGFPEFCDGTTWRAFTLNSTVANLVLTPSQQNTMNVDGSNNLDTTTCTVPSGFSCGSPVIFTLQNQGGATSGTITVSLTNSTNFAKTADTCNGTTLASMASCTITIKPKADGNTTFTGNLQIAANNNPFAIMQGTSINFGCFPGRLGPGGRYVACGLSDSDGSYDLVIIPGGCSGAVNNPSCTGGNDTGSVSRPYGGAGVVFPYVAAYTGAWGARQHQNLMAYQTMASISMPAVQYCNDMVYQGYSDWFLPSRTEWDYVQTAFNAGQLSFVYAAYKLSDVTEYYGYGNHSQEWVSQAGAPYYRGDWRNNSQLVRCVRRDNLPLPSATSDVDPDIVPLTPSVVFSSGAMGTSNTVTISGILQTINASITSGNGAEIILNGTPTGSTNVTGLRLNDTLAFRMNAPTTLGTKNTATITIGPDNYTWWVGYADSTRVARVFVTSQTYGGYSQTGGLSGADNACNNSAGTSTLGLPSGWKAILSDDSMAAADRIPWNWGILKNTQSQTVVDGGFPDLFDGSLDATIGYDQNGTASTAFVWSGTTSGGGIDPGSFNNVMGQANHGCNNWTSPYTYGGSYTYATGGYANQQSSSWIAATDGNCAYSYPIYCIEDIDSALDNTPANINLDYKIQVATSSRQSSSSINIGGMSGGGSATLSVSATGGNPKFTVNGGAEVSSATVVNGDAIVFLMDAPATASSSHLMTITANGTTTLGRWRVWTGWDGVGSGIKRVFVTSTDPNGASFGGVAGGDPVCQSRAAANSLGGTWKAILSGTAESEWAINRVGYNWNELQLVDNVTTVAYAPNLWTTLLNPIIKDEFGNTRSSARVLSGTASNGRSYSSVADISNLYNWTSGPCSATYMQGNSSALSAAITQGYWLCQTDGALFCIEQ